MKEDLLIKYIRHRCSADERMEVRNWLNESSANRERLSEMEQIYALSIEAKYSDEERLDKAYSRLQEAIRQKESVGSVLSSSKRKLWWKKNWLKYAASVLVILSLSANLFFLSKPENDAFTTVIVPKGQRVSLVLSDGSKVWLNSESRFVYPNQFSKDNRRVQLAGEGYFEITRDEKSPFMVSMPVLNIRVLGTKFNARGYEGEPSSVSLKEGSVEVSTVDNLHRQLMEPNDKVYYTKRDGLVLLRNKATPQMDSWTNGDLRFDNQELQTMVRAIERRYDVKIHIVDAELSEEQFTCHFRKDLSILQALDLLKATNLLDYKVKDSDIYLYKRKK